MDKIEVEVLTEGHESPGGMMLFLARLTQRGHSIKDMAGLRRLYNRSVGPQDDQHKRDRLLRAMVRMPHGTITRFSPITIAIVGASRRFLAQARTHQVGMTFVSASLQYSDYTGKADYVVPYELLKRDEERELYLKSCQASMESYAKLASNPDIGRDAAGYAAPQGLRNILIMQGNHQAWTHFIRMRGCTRNTKETQYITLRIWERLLETTDGNIFFSHIGPDCMTGPCREGKFNCGKPMRGTPTQQIRELFPDVFTEE